MKTVSLTDSAKLFASGQVGIIPTDTVYGLACSATNFTAIERFYSLKSRENKPGTLIAASVEQLVHLGFDSEELELVEGYWPASLSAILTLPDHDHLTQSVGSLAVRVVPDPELNKLLFECGPLITSSANLPGEAPANNLDQAFEYFGDAVDFYVDGGELSDRQPSTIVRVSADGLEIVRQGSVAI